MIEHKHNILLIVYLGALAAFAPFTVDSYLPALPGLVKLFHSSATEMQLTLSLFMVSFAVGLLFWGPLSDRMGRKTVIRAGVFIFICGSIGCGLSHSAGQLIVARIIQGFGACAGIVMSLSIIKDVFTDDKEMTSVMSSMISVAMISPMVAPVVGSYLLVHLGWSSIFYFLGCYGLLVMIATACIDESYPKHRRKPMPVSRIIYFYYEQIRSVPFVLMTLAVATNFSVMFSFIASSSFIYINLYSLPKSLYGYFFAINALAVMFGTLTVRYLKNKLNHNKLMIVGIIVAIVGAVSMTSVLMLKTTSIFSVVIPSFIVTYGVGILYPLLTSVALKNTIQHNGLASSIINTTRSVIAAVVGLVLSSMIVSSALPLGVVMLILCLLTAVLYICYLKMLSQKRAQI